MGIRENNIETHFGLKKIGESQVYGKGQKEVLTFTRKFNRDGWELDMELKISGAPEDIDELMGDMATGNTVHMTLKDGGDKRIEDFQETETQEVELEMTDPSEVPHLVDEQPEEEEVEEGGWNDTAQSG